jgi:hypothetical protein
MDESQIDDDDAVLAEGGPLELDGALVTQLDAPAFESEQDLDALFGEDEEDEPLEDDLDLDDAEPAPATVHLDHAFEIEDGDRVAKLETAVKTLAGAQVERERNRVRRKVTAATGGAGAVGLTPIVLQLAGALDLSPEVASAVAAVAAALGALLVGYLTPERAAPPTPAELLSAD